MLIEQVELLGGRHSFCFLRANEGLDRFQAHLPVNAFTRWIKPSPFCARRLRVSPRGQSDSLHSQARIMGPFWVILHTTNYRAKIMGTGGMYG